MIKDLKGLKLKFSLAFLAVMLVLSTATGLIMYKVIQQETEMAVAEKAESNLAMAQELIDRWYPAPWRVEGDKLYKGDVLINNNFEAVDKIGRLTDNIVSIFLGGTCIATNVTKDDGTRAVGTTVSKAVAETVLKKGQDYYDEANVAGEIYHISYTPIIDSSGSIVGMWAVGTSKEFQKGMLNYAVKYIALSSAADAMARGTVAVDEGVEAIQISGQAVEEILEQAKLSSELAEQMAHASEQNSSSIQDLAGSTEQTSEAMQQVAAAAQNLTEIAEELNNLISEYSMEKKKET